MRARQAARGIAGRFSRHYLLQARKCHLGRGGHYGNSESQAEEASSESKERQERRQAGASTFLQSEGRPEDASVEKGRSRMGEGPGSFRNLSLRSLAQALIEEQ